MALLGLAADRATAAYTTHVDGTDTIVVGDLNGTDRATVDVELNAVGGLGDGQPDTVIANGTSKRDIVDVTKSSGAQVVVTGMRPQTRIVGSEALLDTLLLQTLGGNDDVTIAADVTDLIAPVVDLGADE